MSDRDDTRRSPRIPCDLPMEYQLKGGRSREGRITKLVQLQSPWSPTAVALSGKDLYVLEYLHTEAEERRAWVPRVRKVSADGRSAIIARVKR